MAADCEQNTTFYQYSQANNYVFDQRGFNAFIKGEASTFLRENDRRLLLNKIVTKIDYNANGGTSILMAHISCGTVYGSPPCY